MKRMNAFASAADGAAILELALIAPFLILMAIGIVEIGLYTRVGIEVGNAARAGVQYGSQTTAASIDATGIKSAAIADANEVTSLTVRSSIYCTCHKTPGTHVSSCSPVPVCVTGDHLENYVSVIAETTFTPLIATAGIPSSMTISKTASQLISP